MMRRLRGLGVIALVLALGGSAWAQGVLAPYARLQFFDVNGVPLAGGLLATYEAGTTTPLATYADSALTTPNANPVVLDSAGRVTVYLDATRAYKFILRTSLSVDVWTQDNVIGPFSGVVTITAASTRGLAITRSAAEAGLSLTSSGGSGKTWGLASTTAGELKIQDDADGTPRIEMGVGDAIDLVAIGLVSVPGAGGLAVTNSASVGTSLAVTGATTLNSTLAVTGATTLNSTLAVTGAATLNSTLAVTGATTAAAVTASGLITGTAAATINGGYSTTPAVPSGLKIATQSAVDRVQLIFGDGSGYSLHIGPSVASVFVPVLTIDDRGYVKAPKQPGFLAYNSVLDSVATTATVDFDTEVYDETNNFAVDVFTAPVAGRYHLCATVNYGANAAASYALRLVTTARTYTLDLLSATTAGLSSGCVYADMALSATAFVQVITGDALIDIEGGATPLLTFFSGRLVP